MFYLTHPPLRPAKLQRIDASQGKRPTRTPVKIITFRDTEGGDFFDHLHDGLLLGVPGAWIVGTAGVTMLVRVNHRPGYSSTEY